MNEMVCDICGAKNSLSASRCSRCAEPLDAPTQITPSPFAVRGEEPGAKGRFEGVTEQHTLPHPQPTRRAPQPASSRPTLPATPAPAKADPEATRVVPSDRIVPKEVRTEPALARRELAQPMSRVPTQPLQPRPSTPPPITENLTSLIELTTDAFAPEPALQTKPPLRQRFAKQVQAKDIDREPSRPTEVQAPQPSALVRAKPRDHILANTIDAVVLLAATMACGVLATTLSAHGYPVSRPTAFENAAIWLARSGSLPARIGLMASILAMGYGGLGAYRGMTLGRAALGLVLVNQEGQHVAAGGALWHVLGCALNMVCLGAGTLWALVDRRQRTWACLLSRTQVVPRHQVVPR